MEQRGGYGGGYRYSYPGFYSGGRGRYGRQEPFESGPPSGYGRQWGRAYGGSGGRWGGGDGWGRGYDEPFRGGSGYARSRGYAELPPPPAEYYDDYDVEPFYDDESDGGWAGPSAEPDDGEVQERVTWALQSDGFIDADAIRVEVKERVVTLRGEVKDYMEARYAWDDAWDAPGVRGVISKLTVREGNRQEAPAGAARKAATVKKSKSTKSDPRGGS